MSAVQLKGRTNVESGNLRWLYHNDFLPIGKHGRVVRISLRILIDLCTPLGAQHLV